MARSGEIEIKLQLTSEDLLDAITTLSKENKKAMAKISANTATEEEFALSQLDYDELLETYGEDPVLMTIFNRMKDFFREPEPGWFTFKDWPEGSGRVDASKYLRWDSGTTIDTTSKVSDTFTIKYDSTGTFDILKDSGTKYTVSSE